MHASTPGRRRALAAVIPAIVALSALTACGSSDDSDGSSDASNSSALGTPNKATGSPITIGVISDGKTQAVDQTDEYKGAVAAAHYANDYLGGINGHKIEVKVCETRTDPAAATDCANQMVSAKASAVVEGTLGNADQAIAVLAPAGIPIAAASGSTQTALSTPTNFSLFNGLSYFGAPAQWAQQEGFKKAAMIVIGVPSAEGPAKSIGTMLYANAGVDLKVTAIPPGTADMTPQINAANADKPDMYHVFGDENFCTPAIKAIKAVAPEAKIIGIAQCVGDTGATSIPGGYSGMKVVTTVDLDPANEETKLFQAVLDKYGDGAAFAVNTGGGYSPMLGLISALNAAKISDTSAAGVLAALKSAPATTYPLAAGAKFQCDGKQMLLSPQVCSSNGILASVADDGTLKDYELLPPNPKVYALPTS